jgi:hypothetical protein
MIITGSSGTAAMLLSVIGGETFVTTHNELASYLMSIGFLIGILSLNVGFLTQQRTLRGTNQPAPVHKSGGGDTAWSSLNVHCTNTLCRYGEERT